ncbi:lipase family protein [Nocardia brasiliensis]|uniref:lipase family protein n=1 Tax=Nocardia brasiliensis TaxID=37326 RepID=UPI003D8E4AAD
MPGALIDVAELPSPVRVAEAGRSLSLSYWSRGPHGAMTSTGAVYVPAGAAPAGGWPVVVYAHGTVGIADQCVFSRLLSPHLHREFYPALLRRGYAVLISDYVGLGTEGVHPYLDGESAAHSLIDGMRAARAALPELSGTWMVQGQSQGAHAAFFTSAIAPVDAPELDFRGAAGTGAPGALELVLQLAGPEIPALPLIRTTTYFGLLLSGLRASSPEFDIDSYLTETGRYVLRVVENSCLAAAEQQLRGISIGEMLLRPLNDSAMQVQLHRMLAIPVTGHTRSLFLGQGLEDLDVPLPLTVKLLFDLWAAGADVDFHLYPGDHFDAETGAIPDVLAFIDRVLN